MCDEMAIIAVFFSAYICLYDIPIISTDTPVIVWI